MQKHAVSRVEPPWRVPYSWERCGEIFNARVSQGGKVDTELGSINFFLGGPRWGVLGGGQKVMLNNFMCFFCPLSVWGFPRKTPENPRKITGIIFPNREVLRIPELGAPEKGKPAANLGLTLPCTWS